MRKPFGGWQISSGMMNQNNINVRKKVFYFFYIKGMLVGDVSFNYSDKDCRHFLQVDGELPKPTKMNDEAAAFLKGLAEGKSWY